MCDVDDRRRAPRRRRLLAAEVEDHAGAAPEQPGLDVERARARSGGSPAAAVRELLVLAMGEVVGEHDADADAAVGEVRHRPPALVDVHRAVVAHDAAAQILAQCGRERSRAGRGSPKRSYRRRNSSAGPDEPRTQAGVGLLAAADLADAVLVAEPVGDDLGDLGRPGARARVVGPRARSARGSGRCPPGPSRGRGRGARACRRAPRSRCRAARSASSRRSRRSSSVGDPVQPVVEAQARSRLRVASPAGRAIPRDSGWRPAPVASQRVEHARPRRRRGSARSCRTAWDRPGRAGRRARASRTLRIALAIESRARSHPATVGLERLRPRSRRGRWTAPAAGAAVITPHGLGRGTRAGTAGNSRAISSASSARLAGSRGISRVSGRNMNSRRQASA